MTTQTDTTETSTTAPTTPRVTSWQRICWRILAGPIAREPTTGITREQAGAAAALVNATLIAGWVVLGPLLVLMLITRH